MGYMMCQGYCANCRRLFSFSPNRVPSIRVKGVKEPVCRTCIERANPERVKRGLPELVIPEGAYEPEECV